ncbi:MAG: holo-ACP synthase [Microthrixaceae bacterium]
MTDTGAVPVAVGTDLVEIERLRAALDRTPGLHGAFTSDELDYARTASDPVPRLAARWAAKEAVLKCLGGIVGRDDLAEVEVVRGSDGAPGIRLHGSVARRAAERRIAGWLISLSHERSVAAATVLAIR